MARPIRHHFVPQCYLKQFSNSSGKIYVLPKCCSRSVFETGTNNVAVRKDYYSSKNNNGEYDSKIENILAQIEGLAAPILLALNNREEISYTQKENLAIFIGLMYSRNPNFRDSVEEFHRQVLETVKEKITYSSREFDDLVQTAPDEIVSKAGGRENIRAWLNKNFKITVAPEASLNQIQVGVKIGLYLSRMHWRLWVNLNNKLPFITSDNPCYLFNKNIKKYDHGPGIALKDSSLHFPISTMVFLVADWNGICTEYRNIVNKDKLIRLNSRTIRYAESEIYSPFVTNDILKLLEKNRGYHLTTQINHVGHFHTITKNLAKKDK